MRGRAAARRGASAASSSARASSAGSGSMPARADAGPVGVAEVAGHAAGLCPQAPGQGQGGQAVRRGGGRPARPGTRWPRRSCPARRCRGRRRRRRTGRTRPGRGRRSAVQVPGGVGLGAQHRVDPARGSARSTMPSSSTPAAWTTAVSGCAAGIAASSGGQRGAVGGVAGRHGDAWRPAAARSAARPAAPGAAGPRRLASSRCRAPRGRPGAGPRRPPRVPVPPVISTVPSAVAGRGMRQHDLAGVPGLAHEPERLRRPPHVPGGDRQRLQRARPEQAQHLGEHLPDPLGPGLGQVEGPVGHAGVARRRPAAGRGCRSCPSRGTGRRRAAAPARRRRTPRPASSAPRPRPRRRSAPGTARGTRSCGTTRCAPAVHAQARAARATCPGWPSRTPRRPGAGRPAPRPSPPRRPPRAPAPLPRPAARPGPPARTTRSGTPPAPRPPARTTSRPGSAPAAAVGHRDRAERVRRTAHHPVARRDQRVTPGPASSTTPARLAAQHARLARVHAQRDQHVTEVQPGRAHRDPHLPGPERPAACRARDQRQVVQRAPPARPAASAPAPGSRQCRRYGRPSRGASTLPAADRHLGSPGRGRRRQRAAATARSPATSASTNRPGFSDCADRTSPHTAAAARSAHLPARGHRPARHHHQPRRRPAARRPATPAPAPAPRPPPRRARRRPPVAAGRQRRGHARSGAGAPAATAAARSRSWRLARDRPRPARRPGRPAPPEHRPPRRRRPPARPPAPSPPEQRVLQRRRAGAEAARRRPAAAPATDRHHRRARPRRPPPPTPAPSPPGDSRTRSADAPAACSDTPARRTAAARPLPPAGPAGPAPTACSAASSSAGCTPNPPAAPAAASSGSATSANTSSAAPPGRPQPAERRPVSVARPRPAPSYKPSTATGSAPARRPRRRSSGRQPRRSAPARGARTPAGVPRLHGPRRASLGPGVDARPRGGRPRPARRP